MPKNPKLMFQICQKEREGLRVVVVIGGRKIEGIREIALRIRRCTTGHSNADPINKINLPESVFLRRLTKDTIYPFPRSFCKRFHQKKPLPVNKNLEPVSCSNEVYFKNANQTYDAP